MAHHWSSSHQGAALLAYYNHEVAQMSRGHLNNNYATSQDAMDSALRGPQNLAALAPTDETI